MAADLVSRGVAVLAASGPVATLPAKAATATVPIVFIAGVDPVKLGVVASLARPVANVTGVSFFATELGSKLLGLPHELVPNATVTATAAA